MFTSPCSNICFIYTIFGRIPIIGGKDLDLHKLFKEVTSRGGIDKVKKNLCFYTLCALLQIISVFKHLGDFISGVVLHCAIEKPSTPYRFYYSPWNVLCATEDCMIVAGGRRQEVERSDSIIYLSVNSHKCIFYSEKILLLFIVSLWTNVLLWVSRLLRYNRSLSLSQLINH